MGKAEGWSPTGSLFLYRWFWGEVCVFFWRVSAGGGELWLQPVALPIPSKPAAAAQLLLPLQPLPPFLFFPSAQSLGRSPLFAQRQTRESQNPHKPSTPHLISIPITIFLLFFTASASHTPDHKSLHLPRSRPLISMTRSHPYPHSHFPAPKD